VRGCYGIQICTGKWAGRTASERPSEGNNVRGIGRYAKGGKRGEIRDIGEKGTTRMATRKEGKKREDIHRFR